MCCVRVCPCVWVHARVHVLTKHQPRAEHQRLESSWLLDPQQIHLTVWFSCSLWLSCVTHTHIHAHPRQLRAWPSLSLTRLRSLWSSLGLECTSAWRQHSLILSPGLEGFPSITTVSFTKIQNLEKRNKSLWHCTETQTHTHAQQGQILPVSPNPW